MDFSELVQARRSIRTFTDRVVDDKTIKRLVECARLAPSWKNWQCWHFIIIRDRKKIVELVEGGHVRGNLWLKNAPVLIVACGEVSRSGNMNGIPYFAVDVSIALEHIVLAATEEGLGTCWVGIFDDASLRDVLNIPETMRIVALSPLGYPADKMDVKERLAKSISRPKVRKPLAEILHWESFPSD